jgi:hypothetical protein
VLGRDRLADQRVAHDEVIGPDEPVDGRHHQHQRRREEIRQRQRHDGDRQHGVGAPQDEEHRAAAEAVVEDAKERCGERAEELQRAEEGEHQHGSGVDEDVPGQDQVLHLGRPRGEEIRRELEAEAADAERGDQAGGGTSLCRPS